MAKLPDSLKVGEVDPVSVDERELSKLLVRVGVLLALYNYNICCDVGFVGKRMAKEDMM